MLAEGLETVGCYSLEKIILPRVLHFCVSSEEKIIVVAMGLGKQLAKCQRKDWRRRVAREDNIVNCATRFAYLRKKDNSPIRKTNREVCL
jgi:hypothetical protein